jgi:hypothetical protein
MRKFFILFILFSILFSVTKIYAQRINTTPELNQSIDYAWLLSGKDMDFILTIEAESRWDIKAI